MLLYTTICRYDYPQICCFPPFVDYMILRIDILYAYRTGVVYGGTIFGPPLEEYWSKKLQLEAAKKRYIGNGYNG